MKKIILIFSLLCLCFYNGNGSVLVMADIARENDTWSLTITGYDGPIREGSTLQLQAILTPSSTMYNVYTWSSSNTAVATVDDNGLVTAVSEGAATITCVLSAEGNTQYFRTPDQTISCDITVIKESPTVEVITFADAEVKRICVENWDTDGDGELSYTEAAAVTDIGTVFKDKKDITTFKELAYFTSLSSIEDEAFRGCRSLTSMTIPNGVTSIGYWAFADCPQLATITIPNSVTSISDAAFSNCTSLNLVDLSSNLSEINGYLFENCSSLTSLSIPSSVSFIGCYAFKGCTGLTSMIIPNSITRIFANAFEGCSGMTTVTIPNRLISIDNFVFKGCSGLTSVTIPNSVKSITKGAFSGCAGLTTVSVPSSVTSIGEYAFSNCRSLASVTISNGVKSIGEYAFSGCRNLTSLFIPKSLTTIAQPAFNSCVSIETIVVEDGNTKYDSRDNCNAVIETASNTLVQGCKSTVIPNSVTTIDIYAFYGCSGLTSVTIPNSVTNIPVWDGPNGTTAFSGCNNLETIIVESGNAKYDSRGNCNALINTSTNSLLLGCKNTVIPNTVTSIKGYAFYGRSGLTSVTIPNSVTSISEYAFQRCPDLTSVIIPNSVTSIGEYAFDGCTSITSVTVGTSNPLSINSSVFPNRTKAILYVPMGSKAAYSAAKYWKDFKEIVEMANIDFADAEVKRICVENWDTNGDGELSFGEAAAVTDIGQVFKANSVITSFVELQYFTGLTSIGDRAFDNCKNLTNLRLPEGISSIELGAFLHCDLHSIYIPASVKEIGIYPFVHNSNLTSIQVDAANTYYDSRNECNAIIETSSNTLIQGCKTTVIPSGIKKIGDFAFEFVDLEHMDLPQGLEEISWCAFYGCANLEEVAFPDGLKSIGRFAYDGCTSLENIVIPASTTYVRGSSFAGCYNIEMLQVAPGSATYISPDGSNAVVSKDGTKLVAGCKNTIIPETVVVIGYECFYDQKNLTTVSIPALVTTIEDYAFCGCDALTEIDIPKNVETIGEYAFSGNRIVSVTVRREVPIAITANVFTNRANSILYVPFGCKAAYKDADYWKDFKEIVELEEDSELDDEIEVTDISSLSDAIYIDPMEGGAGDIVKMEIRLKNVTTPVGCSFSLTLPEGFRLAKDEDNDIIYELDRRAKKMSITMKDWDNGSYNFALTPSSGTATISGNDGTIITLYLHVPEDAVTNKTYGIHLTLNKMNLIVDGQLHESSLSDITTSFYVYDYVLGDVNSDGVVTPADAIMIIYHYFKMEQNDFNPIAADLNFDGFITPSDAIEALELYFDSNSPNSVRKKNPELDPQ